MANRWGNNGNTERLYFLTKNKITADGDCSHEIKRGLLLGRKVMTNLDSIFKSRDITLPTKVHLVKGMVFPVVLPGESQGQRSLVGCHLWGCTESDTTEATQQQQQQQQTAY